MLMTPPVSLARAGLGPLGVVRSQPSPLQDVIGAVAEAPPGEARLADLGGTVADRPLDRESHRTVRLMNLERGVECGPGGRPTGRRRGRERRAPGLTDCARVDRVRSDACQRRAAVTRMKHSASGWATAWKFPIGERNWIRSAAYAAAPRRRCSASPTMYAAAATSAMASAEDASPRSSPDSIAARPHGSPASESTGTTSPATRGAPATRRSRSPCLRSEATARGWNSSPSPRACRRRSPPHARCRAVARRRTSRRTGQGHWPVRAAPSWPRPW